RVGRLGEVGRGGVDITAPPFNGDRFGQAADGERGVDTRSVVDVQHDIATALGLESRKADLHDVGAGGHEVETVGAGLVGRHRAHEAGVGVGSRDGRTRQRRAAGIGNRADDGGAGDLRVRGGDRQTDQADDGESRHEQFPTHTTSWRYWYLDEHYTLLCHAAST